MDHFGEIFQFFVHIQKVKRFDACNVVCCVNEIHPLLVRGDVRRGEGALYEVSCWFLLCFLTLVSVFDFVVPPEELVVMSVDFGVLLRDLICLSQTSNRLDFLMCF